MNFYINLIFSYSILLAAVIGAIRFHKIGSAYYPFIYLMWVATLNEAVSHYLIVNRMYNIVNTNIYCLIESLLLLWFFRRLGNFHRHRWLYPFLFGLFLTIWIWENFILHRFGTAFSSYFIIAYSFPIVLLSINATNTMLVRDRHILRNSYFLICAGIIIFFTFRILVEVFWLYGLTSASGVFSRKVYQILVWINLLCNLIYALAVLWMRKKQQFSLQY